MFFAWFRTRLSTRPPQVRSPQRPARRSFRPQLEVLEGRDVPSTLTVTNNLDSAPGSLRAEIAAAKSGDTIVFAPSLDHHTITLLRELVINKNLTINGPGEFQLTVTSKPYVDEMFDMSNGSRIFEVDGANTTVTVSGLNLQNGGGTVYAEARLTSPSDAMAPYDGYGGAILNFGAMKLDGCMLTSNRAVYGGAIANFGAMTVTNCMTGFIAPGNQAYPYSTYPGQGGDGGVIYNAGTMTVSGCALDRGSAYQGGAVYNAGTLTVTGSTLSGDSAYNHGGGIDNAGALTVLDSIFSSDTPDDIYGSFTDGGGNTFN
jgi:hypothetical protein